MKILNISISEVKFFEHKELLNIGFQTFYEAFGPPVNDQEDILMYLKEKFSLSQIKKELSDKNSTFYFARIDNTTVGYLKLNQDQAQTEAVTGNGLEIERIYISKAYQGKAIGQLLLEKAIQIAKFKHKDLIWLGVWDKNIRAINFYKKNGFNVFDAHQFKLGKEIQTDIMMKLEL